MKAYEIERYTIASDSADEALGVYLEETGNMQDIFIGDLKEGEGMTITIGIRRLTEREMNWHTIPCCEGGDCWYCHDKGETVYLSIQDLIKDRKVFPCVVAINE